jgi:hypothetical protein
MSLPEKCPGDSKMSRIVRKSMLNNSSDLLLVPANQIVFITQHSRNSLIFLLHLGMGIMRSM